MLSEALRLLRVFHDMKQKDLAEEVGVSRSYISEIEKGNRTPSLDVVERYAEVFRVPVSSILFFSERLNSDADNKNDLLAKNAIASKIINFLSMIENNKGVDDVA